MIDMTRLLPHLTLKAGIWLCVGCRVCGAGSSALASYESWSYFLAYHKEKRA